ncbi:thiamine phosphate synthase [Paenibacillus selenitireducens]
MRELHVISTGDMPLAQFTRIAAAIHPDVHAIHIREKRRTARELRDCVQELLHRGIPAHKIYVNDRLDVAWATRIGGVHLAHHSLPVKEVAALSHALRIGCSVHSVAEAKQAANDGADYMFYGHIYDSPSKPGIPSRGLAQLQAVANVVSIPVIAIGGIQPEKVTEILQHGAQGIAVLSGVMKAHDPVGRVRQYAEKLNERR